MSPLRDKAYLSVDEVAAQFGVTPTTVYRLAQRGSLPGFKVGGQWRFSHEMLDSWVADRVTVKWLQAEHARPSATARHAAHGERMR